MPYKILFLASVLYFLSPVCYSQQFNVSWSEEFKVADDYSDAVQLSNGNYLLLKFERLKYFKVQSDLTPDPSIMLVDSKMKVLKESQISIGEKNDFDRRLIRYGKNIFLLYKVLDGKTKTGYINAIKINEQTLLPTWRGQLGAFDADSQNDIADIKFSADSSKVLLFAEAPDRKKENKRFYICVLDTGLKKIWNRNVELPIGNRFSSVYEQDITNDGKVFVAMKHYDKEVKLSTLREDGNKTPSYAYKILVYSNALSSSKEINISIPNHFIEGTKLIYDKSGMVTVAGLYKKKPNGNIVGTFYTHFDSTAKELNDMQTVTFTPEILELVDKDGYGKSGGSDAGLNWRFKIRDIIMRRNGSVDLISEYYDLRAKTTVDRQFNSQETQLMWFYGDIINTNLDKTGKATFTRIPKDQSSTYYFDHLGYHATVVDDKLVLFYNDDEDNMTRDLSKSAQIYSGGKKAVFAAAIIDAKGNLTRRAIYSYRDEKLVVLPYYITRISDSKYSLLGTRASIVSSRTQFGVLEMK